MSGHNDSSTLDDCVNRLPISPPPDTSHVTKQSLGEFCDSHAIFADTNEFSRTIEVTASDHVANIDLLMLVDTVQSSQHCKWKRKPNENIISMLLIMLKRQSFCVPKKKEKEIKEEERIVDLYGTWYDGLV